MEIAIPIIALGGMFVISNQKNKSCQKSDKKQGEQREKESFTNIELFNELAVYLSDNLFNMFKLLDNKWRNLIINELK